MSIPADSWNPQQYDKYKSERSQPFYDLMNMLQSTSHPRVLDLGCGTGELTSELHHFVKADQTCGLDSSDKMLEQARKHESATLRFQKGAIETWTTADKFDIVFSNAALQWCSDHPRLFARIKNFLEPHGQLAIQMPMNHDYPTHVLAKKMSEEEPWNSLLQGEAYDKYSSLLSPEKYATLLYHLGFKEQKVLQRVYGHQLESRDDVVEWVKGSLLTYFQSRLSAQDYERFLREFKERLFKELPDEKPFFYPFKRIFIWGQL
ncbi:methyltransferase domain-containing protein [Bdellovibrio bacteriovorus]|uniref:methyltransferase domain-containing protein n=1 Tax=Bdellovibrio bacteriovorus TaxID=959 RepID=UPI0035A7388E